MNLLVSECGQPQPIQHSKSNLISLFLMGEMVCFACWRAMGPQAYAEWTNCERIEQFENEAWSAEQRYLLNWVGLFLLLVGYERSSAPWLRRKEESNNTNSMKTNEAERKSGANKPINLSLLSSLFWIMKWNCKFYSVLTCTSRKEIRFASFIFPNEFINNLLNICCKSWL